MKKLFLSLLLLVANCANAACPDLYPNGKTIVVPGTVELCNSFFVSLYDPNKRAVIAVFEKLSKGSSVGSSPRLNAFHADTRLANAVTPSEYVGTGYDKGHMAPAQDASNADQMRETFLMTNMTPQEPTLNEQSWKLLEMSVRKDFAKANADFYIANIAIYTYPAKYIGKNVPVPAGYWKIVYTPTGTSYNYAENRPHANVMKVSYADINKLLNAH